MPERDHEELNVDNLTLEEISTEYCPILAISRLPYTVMRASNAENVASLFFESGKFWQRPWDIYCVFPDARLSKKPLLLAPGKQVERLLGEIEHHCHCIDDNFIDKMKRKGFFVTFPNGEAYQPLRIGECKTKAEFDVLRSRNSGPFEKHIAFDQSLLHNEAAIQFRKAVEDAINATKKQQKTSREKQKKQIQKKQLWDRQSKRTERYLGLRPRKEKDLGPENDPSLSWSELQAAIAARDKAQELKIINVSQLAPHKFEDSVVFIAVDVESYERNHNLITEIGIATLDTADIKQMPPGDNGKNWQSKIRARHIRVKEHANYCNSEFVNGCADKFEFGSSEFAELSDVKKIIADCFRPPYSAFEGTKQSPERIQNLDKRNIILVGHDPHIDIRYLQKLGYDPSHLSNLLEVVDTATLDKVWKKQNQQRSLGSILYDLNMVSWHLHNAGNDAVYTLWAMMGVAIHTANLRATEGLDASTEIMRYEVRIDGNNDDLSEFEDSDDSDRPRKVSKNTGW